MLYQEYRSFNIITVATLKNYIIEKTGELNDTLKELNKNKIFTPNRKKLLQIKKQIKDINFTLEIIKEKAYYTHDPSLIIKADKLEFLIYQIQHRLENLGIE